MFILSGEQEVYINFYSFNFFLIIVKIIFKYNDTHLLYFNHYLKKSMHGNTSIRYECRVLDSILSVDSAPETCPGVLYCHLSLTGRSRTSMWTSNRFPENTNALVYREFICFPFTCMYLCNGLRCPAEHHFCLSASFLPGTSRQMKKSLAIFSYLDIDSNRFTLNGGEGNTLVSTRQIETTTHSIMCLFRAFGPH